MAVRGSARTNFRPVNAYNHDEKVLSVQTSYGIMPTGVITDPREDFKL
jgi:hypothetical protein